MQTSLIGLEACSGAHFLGRALRKQRHDLQLITAQFVKSNKNDFVDAAPSPKRSNARSTARYRSMIPLLTHGR
jgi:transposase